MTSLLSLQYYWVVNCSGFYPAVPGLKLICCVALLLYTLKFVSALNMISYINIHSYSYLTIQSCSTYCVIMLQLCILENNIP